MRLVQKPTAPPTLVHGPSHPGTWPLPPIPTAMLERAVDINTKLSILSILIFHRLVAKLAAFMQLCYVTLQRVSDVTAMLRVCYGSVRLWSVKTFLSFSYLLEISKNLHLTGAKTTHGQNN